MENKLIAIQAELKVPKDLDNKFANYKYRSCESILEELKPLLIKQKCELTLSDEIVLVGNRVYVKATATLIDDPHKWIVTAFAREEEVKKGMDSSQITGAASSYARKYALNGLFLIDDTKDSDHTNTGESKSEPEHKHTDLSKLAPKDTSVKTAIGLIIDQKAPNAGGYVAFRLDDGKSYSTKDSIIIETLSDRKADGDKVGIEYTEPDNPKFAKTIVGLVAVELGF
jgi:hypothetical protein